VTAVIGVVIWKESGSLTMVFGIVLIIAGVILLNLKSVAH
jgi:small multidrug resistance pump